MQKMNKDVFVDFLLGAIPELNQAWDEFKEDWKDDLESEDEGLPIYLFLNDIARFVVANRDTINWEMFSANVETAISEGDNYVIEACTVGLLEDIQNIMARQNIPFSEIEQKLNPKSSKMWHRVIDFWEKGVLIQND